MMYYVLRFFAFCRFGSRTLVKRVKNDASPKEKKILFNFYRSIIIIGGKVVIDDTFEQTNIV